MSAAKKCVCPTACIYKSVSMYQHVQRAYGATLWGSRGVWCRCLPGSTDKANRRVHLATAAAVLLQTPLFFPNIRFLQYSLSLHPPPAPPSQPLPHLVYIITSLWSAAAPHRHCHGNSCTTAGWLPLLPGGVASHPHTLLLCSHSSWRSPVPLPNAWIKMGTSVWIGPHHNETLIYQRTQL